MRPSRHRGSKWFIRAAPATPADGTRTRDPRGALVSDTRSKFRRRRIAVAGLLTLALLLGVAAARGSRSTHRRAPSAATPSTPTAATNGNLAPGSDPSVLPGPLLIADEGNNRLVEIDRQGNVVWEFPRPGDLAPGQTFKVPDDAFFSADGKQIVATEEDDFVVSVIDVAHASDRLALRDARRLGFGRQPAREPRRRDDVERRFGVERRHQELPDRAPAPGLDHARRRVGQAVSLPPPCTSTSGREPQRRVPAERRPLPRHRDHPRLGQRDRPLREPARRRSGTCIPGGSTTPPTPTRSGRACTSPSTTGTRASSRSSTRPARCSGSTSRSERNELYRPSLAEALPNGDVIATDDYNHRVIVVDPQDRQGRLAVRPSRAGRRRAGLSRHARRTRSCPAVLTAREVEAHGLKRLRGQG